MGAVLRGVALLAGGVGVLAGVGLTAGRRWGVAVALLLVFAWFCGRVFLPRIAHRAFLDGAFRRAGFLYGALAAVRLDPAARAAARVSRAAARVGSEDWPRALAALGERGEPGLADPVRAAWLNNRAYALARSGGPLAEAVELADAAVTLRPDVPGFRHTRGLVLLAAGRLDEAIRELDQVWRRADERAPQPMLEAERCYDLGRAWEGKGDVGHAADYFDRARRSAPGSRWAERAQARLTPGLRSTAALDDLLL